VSRPAPLPPRPYQFPRFERRALPNGMRLVMEQPNLDVPDENHLYFDMGDGRLLTFFVRPTRHNDPTPNPEGIGNLHHLAFTVSHAVYTQVAQRLNDRGIWNTGPIDRGFMDSIYFRDPNGYVIELAAKLPNHDSSMDPATNGAREKLDRWTAARHRQTASVS
jgi:catechol 2,3-dioxygenase-like lactoylglutathione lyase family enzyme